MDGLNYKTTFLKIVLSTDQQFYINGDVLTIH